MDDRDLIRALGNIEGNLQQYKQSVDDKFDVLFKELKETKKNFDDLEKRVTLQEIDKKIVAKIASVVSFLTTSIFGGIITFIVRINSK